MPVTKDQLAAWMKAFAEAVHENASYLTELDAAIGDADHGANMDRGMKAVVAIIDGEFADPAAMMKKVGMTLVSSVGGASGPLYGTFFMRFGAACTSPELTTAELGTALRAGVEGIQQRGKAVAGEKTMLDAWLPAVDAFDAAGDDLSAALQAAAQAAADGRDATKDLVATKGRASYLGERAKGHIDPGATSTTYLLEAAAKTLGS